MIKCIAIDDEPKALDVIKNHVSKIDYVRLENVFTDAYQAINYLNASKTDLIFLDIDMPDIDGMSLVKHLTRKPYIIFTTAHSEYALESYEVEAIDFLCKPFDFSRFLTAVNKVKDRMIKSPITLSAFFFVNSGNQKIKLVYDEILFIKGDGNYITYYTKSGKVLVRASITESQSELPPNTFIQIHRSTIVSLLWIEKVEDNHVYIDGHKFPIGATFRQNFFNVIGIK